MSKINILRPDVFNMIAAGEVVERPASVVKELLENSLDAGATAIDITVLEGGIRSISVSDNGAGIAREDMHAAFLPHATSKLKEITDLDTVSTLGFRGEALASIASVSEVTALSRTKNDDAAHELRIRGGETVSECDKSRAPGTTVTVENLFFNTPARLKFLRRPSTELAYIRETVERAVLANPAVRMTLSSEDGRLLTSEGGSLRDAALAVYPASITSRMLEVDRTASSGITVKGYVSAPGTTTPTRSRQTTIVNGRVVSDDTVTAAVEKAYQGFLVKRTYPAFVLDILLPFDEVDVNVHPAKAEVRFRSKNAVFGAVYRAVSEVVSEAAYGEKAGFEKAPEQELLPSVNYEQIALDAAALYDDMAEGGPLSARSSSPRETFDISSLRTVVPAGSKPGRAAETALGAYKASASPANSDAEVLGRLFDTEKAVGGINSRDFTNSFRPRFSSFDGKVVGQVFGTYLIVEKSDRVYIIDQHAAHERVLYDKLMSGLGPDCAQPLLVPHKIRPSGGEAECLERLMPVLCEMGFDIEKNGESYLVYAVPAPLVKMDFSKFLSLLYEDAPGDEELSIRSLMKEKISREACRAAIKGGEFLTDRQIEYVLGNLIDENGDLPASCPHGRPAVVTLTRRDFEKMFMRVVG